MSHRAAAGTPAILLAGKQATAVCAVWSVGDLHLQRAAACCQAAQYSGYHSRAEWHSPGSLSVPLCSKNSCPEYPGPCCMISGRSHMHQAVPEMPATPAHPFIKQYRQGASCTKLVLRPGEGGIRALHNLLSLLSGSHCHTLLCERLLQTFVQGSLGSICSKGICRLAVEVICSSGTSANLHLMRHTLRSAGAAPVICAASAAGPLISWPVEGGDHHAGRQSTEGMLGWPAACTS